MLQFKLFFITVVLSPAVALVWPIARGQDKQVAL